jgi:hypothetical protein
MHTHERTDIILSNQLNIFIDYAVLNHILHLQDKRSYYHECFLRGRPELTSIMQRLCNPGKRLPDKSGEPNFYEISKKYPLPELPPALARDPTSKVQIDASYVMKSPHVGQPETNQFMFPPPNMNGSYNMYGYPQASHFPSIPSSAADPKQPRQYLSGQVAPFQFHPNPYGFYPYPHMMMSPQLMRAGPQGYFVPYQQPQLFLQPQPAQSATPNGAAEKPETTSTVLADEAKPVAQADMNGEEPTTAKMSV